MAKADWKKMGFGSEEEYTKFLDKKLRSFYEKLESDTRIHNVMKRLKNR